MLDNHITLSGHFLGFSGHSEARAQHVGKAGALHQTSPFLGLLHRSNGKGDRAARSLLFSEMVVHVTSFHFF